MLGCESEVARADLLGVTYQTVYRARSGAAVGGQFVAQTLAVLNRHADTLRGYNLEPTFDEVFEVVDADDLAGVAAA